MMQGSDLREAKALYELRRPYGECLHRLESHPAVDEAELTDGERSEGFADAREWFETLPSDAEPSLLLGRIVLGQSHWRLECIGGKRIAEFRRQFESLMGPLARFSGERLDDTIPSVDPLSEKTLALVPPRLLENPDRIEITASRIAPGDTDPEESLAMEEKRLRLAFIDRPAATLDGKSAREASRDPALRPRLVELLKNQIRTLDLENRRRGTGHDLDDILRELGLDELIFPPPPLSAGDFSDDGDDDGESSGSGAHAERREADADRPAAPPLPAEPLTFAESQKRLNRAMETFRTPDRAEDDMDASGTAVLDDLNEVIGDLLDDDEFEQLLPIVISVWYGLVAPGSAAPEIDADRLADVFDREYDAMDQTLDGPTPRLIEDLALRSPQPDYGRMCAVYFAAAMDGFPRKRRPLPDAQLVMLAALFAVIERLDAALRPKRI
ncbi:MAG: hypothetical protein DVB31_11995 [Verrucomicrobia bacterium]|nr:MAG: hypothetical protein DVB31_11995 [Verrucomicrobiota bacterium]